jgi:hypothetical protein
MKIFEITTPKLDVNNPIDFINSMKKSLGMDDGTGGLSLVNPSGKVTDTKLDTTPSSDTSSTDTSSNKSSSSDTVVGKKGSVNPTVVKSYLASKGLDKQHVAGIMSNIKHESGFRPGVLGDNGTSGGLFQHHAERFSAMRKAAGPDWQTNWKGQIDFALSEPAGQRYINTKFSTPEEATKWFTINFEIPANKVAQANIRSQSASQFA